MTPSPLDDSSVFRSLFSAYPDSLLLVDTAGHIVLANPSAAELLGYGADELQGLSVEDLVPDSIRPRHAAYRQAYSHNPRPRPMGTQMELVAKRKDGSEVMVEIALSPLMDKGLPYVVAAIRDIGAYPRARQALQRARYAEYIAQMGRLAVDSRDTEVLFRQVPVAATQALQVEVAQVYLLEPNGANFRVAAGVGMPPGEEVGALVPNRADTPPGYLFAQNKPVVVADYRAETRFHTPQGYLDAGLVSALGVPLLDKGRTIGAVTVRSREPQRFGEDEVRFLESLANMLITVLQRAESDEALRHAQRLESVGQLTGGIAHDFNNLLTVIQGNLQVMEDLPAVAGDDYALQLVAAAARATRRGAELTSKLLAFSRRQVLQPRRIDVAGMLQSLADMLRRTLDQRIRIEVQASDCPPCLADPGQLESALLNVAINARDAMPDGGSLSFIAERRRVLPLALRGELADAEYVTIAIRDSGTGMPDDVKERAFEPFFTTKEAGRGTGLGLSTVYGFAKQSKGAVTIDSAIGQGTTITLFLPIDALAAETAARRKSTSTGVPPGLKVLLVEDEPEVLRVVQAFLTGWSAEVTPCGTAEQALVLLQDPAARFDLLLSDVVLGPGMRGTELVARARELRPELACLLMSGYASDLRRGEPSLADAMPDLLRKPFMREELAAAIAKVIPARA